MIIKKLYNRTCIACTREMPNLDDNELNILRKHIKNDWILIENKKISKEFEFNDFNLMMNFVNKVAELAEKEKHHPVIYIDYNKVNIKLWTHIINGLTENDFIIAAKIDELI